MLNARSEIKLRKEQRDYLMEKLSSEPHLDETTTMSYAILRETLQHGILVGDDDSLDKIVEINSIVAVKTSFGFKFGLRIVLPEEADLQFNRMSVLSSLGCALYGRKEGDKVRWYFEGKEETAEIIRVIQPREDTPLASRRWY
ncbi:MAG: GreA/GreB family elongation factor [Flavobacteriales bacterium]|nr:GreA/GreB family elongation factor [Flavobacteriales bacterium]